MASRPSKEENQGKYVARPEEGRTVKVSFLAHIHVPLGYNAIASIWA